MGTVVAGDAVRETEGHFSGSHGDADDGDGGSTDAGCDAYE